MAQLLYISAAIPSVVKSSLNSHLLGYSHLSFYLILCRGRRSIQGKKGGEFWTQPFSPSNEEPFFYSNFIPTDYAWTQRLSEYYKLFTSIYLISGLS